MTGDTYVVLEHEVGKPFEPPDEAAQVVKCCGHVERMEPCAQGWDVKRRYVLVLWAYPTR